jgi:hypothetical protein
MEKPEHKQIKLKMQEVLRSWLEGADINEYPYSGQEVDVFEVLYEGTTIMVEIIWDTGFTHFLRHRNSPYADMILVILD